MGPSSVQEGSIYGIGGEKKHVYMFSLSQIFPYRGVSVERIPVDKQGFTVPTFPPPRIRITAWVSLSVCVCHRIHEQYPLQDQISIVPSEKKTQKKQSHSMRRISCLYAISHSVYFTWGSATSADLHTTHTHTLYGHWQEEHFALGHSSTLPSYTKSPLHSSRLYSTQVFFHT